VVVDLPTAYVSPRSAPAPSARRDGPGLSSRPLALAEERTKATREREQRLTTAIAFRQRPRKTWLPREASRQELHLGLADQAMALRFREAAQ
jgi:hypothetical protein